jgi:serine-type D-Ala-D-Ala carboxypeptidase (penicillin-binding protein 5/6)
MNNRQRDLTAAAMWMLFISVFLIEGVSSVANFFVDEPKEVSYAAPSLHINNFTNDNIFQPISVTGSHAIVYDIKNDKILYEKDAYVVHPIASITKVVSALVSDEILRPDHKITINQNALSQNSNNGLILDEKWTFKNLLDFSLLVSSNDGAYAIASIAGALQTDSDDISTGEPVEDFVSLMNKRVREIGLRNIHFNNPSGLDVNKFVGGGYGTAFEIAKLFEYITEHNYKVLEITQLQSTSLYSEGNVAHKIKNTNTTLNNIPALISSKTGFTTLAGGNLAVVFDVGINHPIAVVVLGSTQDDRFTDVSDLVAATTSYFSQ